MVQTQALMDTADMPEDELKRIASDYKKNRNDFPIVMDKKIVGKITDIFYQNKTLFGKIHYL